MACLQNLYSTGIQNLRYNNDIAVFNASSYTYAKVFGAIAMGIERSTTQFTKEGIATSGIFNQLRRPTANKVYSLDCGN